MEFEKLKRVGTLRRERNEGVGRNRERYTSTVLKSKDKGLPHKNQYNSKSSGSAFLVRASCNVLVYTTR